MDAETRAMWLAHARYRAYCRLEGITDPEKNLLANEKALKAFRSWLEGIWPKFRALKRCEVGAPEEQRMLDAWLLELSPEGSSVKESAAEQTAKQTAKPAQRSLFG